MRAAVFDEGECQHGRALRDSRKYLLFLLSRAANADGGCAEQHRREEWTGKKRLAHLFDDHARVEEASAHAAEALRDQETEPAEICELFPKLGRVRGLVLHHLANERRRTLGLEELAGALAQHLLFFAEPEVHRVPAYDRRPRPVKVTEGVLPLTPGLVLRYRSGTSSIHLETAFQDKRGVAERARDEGQPLGA